MSWSLCGDEIAARSGFVSYDATRIMRARPVNRVCVHIPGGQALSGSVCVRSSLCLSHKGRQLGMVVGFRNLSGLSEGRVREGLAHV